MFSEAARKKTGQVFVGGGNYLILMVELHVKTSCLPQKPPRFSVDSESSLVKTAG